MHQQHQQQQRQYDVVLIPRTNFASNIVSIGRLKTVSAVAILRYQESKRACCANTFSPISTIDNQQDNRYRSTIRKPKESCDLRKCKYAKSQAETTYCNTQKLLDKIQNLKKSIQEAENTQSRSKQGNSKRRDVPSQTQELKITDLNAAREVVNDCIMQMTKLKTFLNDENCWWKLFKTLEFDCCEQKLPHLHGYLDGTMVTLKMLEETLDKDDNFTTSTPIKSNSLTTVDSNAVPERKKQFREQYIDSCEEDTRKYKDSGIGPSLSFQLNDSNSHESCQRNCPFSCTSENQSKAPDIKDEETNNLITFDSEPPERSEMMEKFVGTEARISSIVKLPRELRFGRSSTELGETSRIRTTFSSENTANRKIIAADISTSTDLIVVLLRMNY
ncbi:uncharacterized protein LOC143346035 [Colletes latitarsis]|uniref:uncharacterized protein LOC143346035 n=1 Tax=Colletes latitarsis TaxID=2605962 RepID=UPI0040365EAE